MKRLSVRRSFFACRNQVGASATPEMRVGDSMIMLSDEYPEMAI